MWARAWAAQYQIYSERFCGDLATRQLPGPMQSLASHSRSSGLGAAAAPLSGLMRISLLNRERDGAIGGLWVCTGKKQGNEILDFAPRDANPARMRVADAIADKLTAAFTPVALEVRDESASHAGHAGATRPDGGVGETHFHVRMITVAFEGISRVERQRRVHAALAEELRGPVHALSLKLQTPAEASASV